jgi:hypothetical protein
MNLTQEQKNRITNRVISELSISVERLSSLLKKQEAQESNVYQQALKSKKIQEDILKDLKKNEQ